MVKILKMTLSPLWVEILNLLNILKLLDFFHKNNKTKILHNVIIKKEDSIEYIFFDISQLRRNSSILQEKIFKKNSS